MNKLILNGMLFGVSIISFNLNVVIAGTTIYLAVKEASKDSVLKIGL